MAATQQMSPQQANAIARQMILAQSVEMCQSIYTTTVVPANTPVINVVPRNVGLIKGFIVEITATITNTAGAATLLSDFNAANILQQVVFTDLNNNVRIQTSGWHLNFLDSAKWRRPFGSSSPTDSPIKYGSNFNVISATASIAASGTGTVVMKYWVPLAYSDMDLRGSVYANVVNATMNLQLTLNTALASIASGDSTLAVYVGNAGSVTSATVNVYQVYLDQLPIGNSGPVLPLLDLQTIYELKNTSLTGVTANQDFPIPYANFRSFLSTFAIYNQNGTRVNGSDVNYWALQSANYTNIFKQDPFLCALNWRERIETDFPTGVYYFDFRDKPISTVQYGNMQLVLNPSSAAANSNVLVGFESFAIMNQITGAGSLPAS